ncbi:hypothetical protein [Burkholderia sp. BCC0419]|uniref:hypothetical protein n=1 Tax=Burkholderia sp. BCC0419 TaxID=486878 RepID=UPI001ABBA0F7|nr:hypothetical protein [Burkholderia sp. BCC0419]
MYKRQKMNKNSQAFDVLAVFPIFERSSPAPPEGKIEVERAVSRVRFLRGSHPNGRPAWQRMATISCYRDDYPSARLPSN